MKLQQMLETRVRERSDLIHRITSTLEADSRVRAAWLSGSLARDDHDALSDIDLWLVIGEDEISDIVAHRKEFATRIANPSLIMDNLSNAPPGGAYLLVHYPGEVGPHHVDWFWQPESLAKKPDDVLVLFDRASLPPVSGDEWRDEMHQTVPSSPIEETDKTSVLTFKITFFWAMALIVAKYIARRDRETAHRMTGLIARTLDDIRDSFGEDLSGVGSGRGVEDGIAMDTRLTSPDEQFAVLDSLAQDANHLIQAIEASGGSVPTEGIRQIHRFIELTKQMSLTE